VTIARRLLPLPSLAALDARRAVEGGRERFAIDDFEVHARDHERLAVGVPELRDARLEDRADPDVVEDRRECLLEVVDRGRRLLAHEARPKPAYVLVREPRR